MKCQHCKSASANTCHSTCKVPLPFCQDCVQERVAYNAQKDNRCPGCQFIVHADEVEQYDPALHVSVMYQFARRQSAQRRFVCYQCDQECGYMLQDTRCGAIFVKCLSEHCILRPTLRSTKDQPVFGWAACSGCHQKLDDPADLAVFVHLELYAAMCGIDLSVRAKRKCTLPLVALQDETLLQPSQAQDATKERSVRSGEEKPIGNNEKNRQKLVPGDSDEDVMDDVYAALELRMLAKRLEECGASIATWGPLLVK